MWREQEGFTVHFEWGEAGASALTRLGDDVRIALEHNRSEVVALLHGEAFSAVEL